MKNGINRGFVYGNVRPAHREMRAAAGSRNIWIVGGGDLAGQFFDAGLLDEMIVQIGSVTLPAPGPESDASLGFGKSDGSSMAEHRYEVLKP